ncbi:MAG: hypothetical protein NPINA01_18930 [Nitrospinaceae bacterium]|nr:MAG: hypothetical protein NPINA01_18930 [Nitrospinaceae bacterium]
MTCEKDKFNFLEIPFFHLNPDWTDQGNFPGTDQIKLIACGIPQCPRDRFPGALELTQGLVFEKGLQD